MQKGGRDTGLKIKPRYHLSVRIIEKHIENKSILKKCNLIGNTGMKLIFEEKKDIYTTKTILM